MILITGATGFIGNRLADLLVNQTGLAVRVLLKPGSDAGYLPEHTPLYIIPGDLRDEAALRVATGGVHTIIHLAATDNRGRHAQLSNVDIQGTKTLVKIARENHVGRIITLSRVGADRQSAYEVLKTKGEIEDAIVSSGIAYTIFRSSVVFGADDHFSENIAMLVSSFPLYSVPGDGSMPLQPLWVEDLTACILLALEDHEMIDQIISLGGPEVLPFRRIVMRVMYAMEKQRPIIDLPPLFHKWGAWYLDGLFQRWPYSEYFVELISSNQTAELGLIERRFGFRPAAFDLAVLRTYLHGEKHFSKLLSYLASVD